MGSASLEGLRVTWGGGPSPSAMVLTFPYYFPTLIFPRGHLAIAWNAFGVPPFYLLWFAGREAHVHDTRSTFSHFTLSLSCSVS